MPVELEELLRQELPGCVGPCYFRRRGDDYLLTNDFAQHVWLAKQDFSGFMSGRAEGPVREQLRDKGFLRDQLDFPRLIEAYARQRIQPLSGPGLHVVAVTLQNNQATPYGALDASGVGRKSLDMTLMTARNLIRFVFDSPNPHITVELRGGEPLMHWEGVEYIVRYAREFAETAGRKVRLGMVSNLSLLDDQRLDFLMKNKVELCVPFDGPAPLHDKHRRMASGSSHAEIRRWLKVIAERYPDAPKPQAWLTVTADSLGQASRIATECAESGFASIHPRPVLPLAQARAHWGELGVSAPRYLEFYSELLSRVLELGLSGAALVERNAALLLTKILAGRDPGLVELRSPSGGGLAQLSYQQDGDIFLTDEGRWLSQEHKDHIFRLGEVTMAYREVIHHPTVKACAVASDLEAQPMCSSCAYKPFCGVSPVYNYATQGTIWGRNPTNERCALYMGYFDLIFAGLRHAATRELFETWVEPSYEGPVPAFLTGGCQ